MRRLVAGRGLRLPRTGPGDDPAADAVLVVDGRVAAVGRREVLAAGADRVDEVDGLVVPAFRDAHIHPLALTAAAGELDLSQARSVEEVVDLVRGRHEQLPDGTALVGRGLDDERIGRLPTRHDLDRAVGGRPALVHRVCTHVAVASTAALDLAGVGPGTPDPDGGSFGRDAAGVPDGVLRETAVTPLVAALEHLLPTVGPADLLGVLGDLASRGHARIDAIASAGTAMWCGTGAELATLLAVAPDLPLRVDVLVATEDPAELKAAAEACAGAGGRLRFAGWKGFADGSLGGRTAALRRPYADAPGVGGTLRLRPGRHGRLVEQAWRSGGTAAIHAIGDRAVAETLDLFAGARARGVDVPLRLEHASVLDARLIARMADLGVVASVQPSFATSDAPWLEARLGRDRARWAYPFRSLLEAGVRVLAGSDAPVEPADPWTTVSAAVLHTRPGSPEALTAAQALAVATVPFGTGEPADLVVVDRDPLRSEAAALRETEVRAVYLAGEPVAGPGRQGG